MTFTAAQKFRFLSCAALFSILTFMCVWISWGWITQLTLTTLSCALLLALLLSIRNALLRMVLVDLFFLISGVSFAARVMYGIITKDMILATVGVSFNVSVGLFETVPALAVAAFAGFMLAVSALAYHAYIRIPGNLKFYLLPLPLFVSLLNPVRTSYQWLGYYWFINDNMYQPTYMAQDYIDYYKIFWGDVVAAGMIGIEAVTDGIKYAHVQHDKMPPYVTRGGEGDDKIIFVIGEASNVRRYSAFGYSLPTTPLIDAMVKDKQVCLVDKVHSATPTTRTAVPMYVSFATPQNRQALFTYKNIFEMAHDNGYQTVWIGSQLLTTLWDKTYYFVARYADMMITPNVERPDFNVRESKDDDLIAPLKHFFSTAPQKAFFVVHLTGNHLSYESRVDDEDRAALPSGDAYDQSVHHVDRVLKQIKDEADRAFGSSYQLVYLPDHGEAVNYGHGYATQFNEMFLIPFLANRQSTCDAFSKLRGPDGYASSDTVKYLILQMLGYRIDDTFLRNAAAHSYQILNGYEQVTDFRKLETCASQDCPN